MNISIGFSAVLYRRILVLTTHSSVPTCKHHLCCWFVPDFPGWGPGVKQSCRGCGISSPSVGWTLAATARTTSVVVCPFVPLAWKHKDKSLNILPTAQKGLDLFGLIVIPTCSDSYSRCYRPLVLRLSGIGLLMASVNQKQGGSRRPHLKIEITWRWYFKLDTFHWYEIREMCKILPSSCVNDLLS